MKITDINPSFTNSWIIVNNGLNNFGFDYNLGEISLYIKVKKDIPLTGLVFIPLCLIVVSYLNNRYSNIIKSAILYYKNKQIGFSDDVFNYLRKVDVNDFKKSDVNIYAYDKNDLEIEITADEYLQNIIDVILNKNIFDVDKHIDLSVVDYKDKFDKTKIEFYVVRHRW